MMTAAGAELAAPDPLALLLRDEFLGRLGCRDQHDVVIDLDRPLVFLETVQARELDLLGVPSATEETDVAVVLERRVHLDRHKGLGMAGALDLVLRHLDEVRPAEHVPEALDQVRIGGAHGGVARPLAGVVRIEIVVGLLQALELGEIFKMKDGAKQPAELAPRFGAARFRDLRFATQCPRNVALAHGNEVAARLACRGLPCRENAHALSFRDRNDRPAGRDNGRARIPPPRSGERNSAASGSFRFAAARLHSGIQEEPTHAAALTRPCRIELERAPRARHQVPQRAGKRIVAPAEETWGPGELKLMELPAGRGPHGHRPPAHLPFPSRQPRSRLSRGSPRRPRRRRRRAGDTAHR